MAQHAGRGLLLACPLASAAVHAQVDNADATMPVTPLREESPPPSPPTSEDSGSTRLEDVVVTATKRPQRLRDIPQSITSLGGDTCIQARTLNLRLAGHF